MTKFNANNKTKSSKELFEEKIKFNAEAYAEIEYPKGIVEFNFFEKIRYGHVNTKNLPVIPDEEFMQPIINSRTIVGLTFDFSVVGVDLIVNHFQNCLRFGTIHQDTVSNLEVMQSYVPPENEYRRGLKLNLEHYNEYLETNKLNKNITGFTSYVKKFMDYYKKNYVYLRPMTLAKHCVSIYSSPLETGLAIKLYPTLFDDDQSKYDDLISSPNFKKYINVCRNYGFSIMKNTPNVIMFDINSAANRIPLDENNITSIENLFETRYKNPIGDSLRILETEFILGYNTYANNNRVTSHVSECNYDLKYTKNILPLVNNINNNYIHNNIINIYTTFKYYEEQGRMSIGKFNQIKNNIKYFQKRFDNDSVIGYINDEFQSLYENEPNNYAAFIRRENEKEVQKLEDETQAQLSATVIEIEGPTIDRSPTQPTGRGTY